MGIVISIEDCGDALEDRFTIDRLAHNLPAGNREMTPQWKAAAKMPLETI
jgi:hypothetical protein